ncbi:hypothetical protein BTN49_1305 [Candidatus Enterovibrio escicola]|uniref:Uncharacterized protein n=1 Tax=Candidatus Enterovibrio escicola TaxID=1927127 RepID=A0A2A5T597_9GAMM|nr:hypothetical protein BTN49_1305 [Candidatus Enterovibrio escacola]
MKVYVGDLSGTFINVKTELRKPSNLQSRSLKIPFTIRVVSNEVLENINPRQR